MAWIKRNLFFVISVAAGLSLTGFCAYLLMGDLSANTEAYNTYQQTIQQLNDLQNKDPFPSAENIAKAKEELASVRVYVADVRKVFVPFPTPPKETEQGFSAYLETTIADMTLKATNAGVGLPQAFSFGFTDLRGKLKYETDNIPLWMQQWEEIKVLCDILYKARINSITAFQRVPVSGSDIFQASMEKIESSTVSNATTIVTPYKITIRTFSRELADVLNGLAHASNCLVVKNIVVYPAGPRSLEPQTQNNNPQPEPMATPEDPEPQPPDFQRLRTLSREDMDRVRQQYNAKHIAWERRRAAAQSRPVASPGATTGVPPTIEREQVLQVTLSVEVVKIKAP